MEKDLIKPKEYVPPELQRFDLETLYLGDSIDLKKVQEKIKEYTYLNQDHPLILRVLSDQYVVLTKFGTATFWNVPQKTTRDFIKEIKPFVENFRTKPSYSDTLKVYVGAQTEKIVANEIYLTNIDNQKIQIISYVSSQSVALERYEDEIEKRLASLGDVIESLKSGQWKNFEEKEILKQIGNILAVKKATISHLSLIDKPDTTWEREEIEKLYNRLYFEYELQDRFDILNEKIKFLSENDKILLDFISSKKSDFLELIMVILILVELAIFVFDTILRSK